MNPFELNGKIALVTGGSYGIGFSIASAYAKAGATIVFNDINQEMIDKGMAAYAAAGIKAHGYVCDVTNEEQANAMIAQIENEVGVIDILVNNAGTILRKPAAEHPDEYWDDVLALNLDAPFILSREFGKQMVERGSGKIIFTCSLLSFQGGILVPGYAASKGALSSLVKALSNEWAGKGVQVNGIAPGYIATDNTEALRQDAERSTSILSRIPAGRWGQPEDFKGPVVFLASPASDYVSGTLLVVDGGWMGR